MSVPVLLLLSGAAAPPPPRSGTEAPGLPLIRGVDHKFTADLVPGFRQRFAVAVPPGVSTLEVIAMVSKGQAEHTRLRVWRDNSESDEGDTPRWEFTVTCKSRFDNCYQHDTFQYTRPSFIDDVEYDGRLALRMHSSWEMSLAGRWQFEVASSTAGDAARLKLVLREGEYTYWGVVLSVCCVAAASACALVALFDLLWNRSHVTRPADARNRPTSVTQQLAFMDTLLARFVSTGSFHEQEGVRVSAIPRTPMALARVLLLMGPVGAIVLHGVSVLCVLCFAVITNDFAGVHQFIQPFHETFYHLLLSWAATLSLCVNNVIFGPVLFLIDCRIAQGMALWLTLSLQVLAGYAGMFWLWTMNSALWDWQVSFCFGTFIVCMYYRFVHGVMVWMHAGWLQKHRREVVIQPPCTASGPAFEPAPADEQDPDRRRSPDASSEGVSPRPAEPPSPAPGGIGPSEPVDAQPPSPAGSESPLMPSPEDQAQAPAAAPDACVGDAELPEPSAAELPQPRE
eukprot:TRINITY_DN36035_c0_g1_i1.p1 TRINITY_DN36035_c0_g1~~TRINITY_DN36035_c0_g1_i1.p1  ORF type:complete len:529 (+),score=146.97 TRINITY_DN36035_c0_g1_i1:57-1589(+)